MKFQETLRKVKNLFFVLVLQEGKPPQSMQTVRGYKTENVRVSQCSIACERVTEHQALRLHVINFLGSSYQEHNLLSRHYILTETKANEQSILTNSGDETSFVRALWTTHETILRTYLKFKCYLKCKYDVNSEFQWNSRLYDLLNKLFYLIPLHRTAEYKRPRS